MEYVHELNPKAVMRAFGQELNPESYAICKGDMLIKGQDVSRIKLGNTLSDDQLEYDRFDYMLSNPPFGVDWKKVEGAIKHEHKFKRFNGRFGPGLPRVSDGSLLFLLHLISKMRDYAPITRGPNDTRGERGKSGGRIGIILNGSPLFTGGAGSGESEIRRYVLESDLLEAIVALPTDMFYNTGIATYVWILSNKKRAERKGKVQLINGVHLYQKMRKSLGSKRQEIGDEGIALITRTFGRFEAVESYRLDEESNQNGTGENGARGRPATTKKKADKKTFAAKIFASYEFGYRRITVERPLRLSVQFTDERIAQLRFDSGKLGPAMQAIYEAYGQGWADGSSGGPASDDYGQLAAVEAEVRARVKADFGSLKEVQIKELLAPMIWMAQKKLLDKARTLQRAIGTDQHDDFNAFEELLKKRLKESGTKLESKEKKQLIAAISWTNPEAEPVIKKVLKGRDKEKANPIYGAFAYRGQVVEFQPDGNLRDNEDVPLTAETARGANVNAVNEAYFNKEVAPHVEDAWIDGGKRDKSDEQVGIVGYEIPFNRLFTEFATIREEQDRIKLKTLLSRDSEGKYVWNPFRMRFSLATDKSLGMRDNTELAHGSSPSNRINIDEHRLNVNYLNLFFASPDSDDWMKYATLNVGHVPSLPIGRLMECEIHLPRIQTQELIVQLSDEHDSLLHRIDSIRTSILSDPTRADVEIQRYLNAGNRFEEEFTHILPHPLSVLWGQAQFAINDKAHCEEFVKFYEYLGLFIVSVIFGQLSEEAIKNTLKKKARGPKKPYITMGTAHKLICHVRSNFLAQIHPQFKPLISENWEELLKEATKIRNEIAHRGIHARASIQSWKSQIDSINEQFTILSRNLFEQIVLVRPKSANYINSSGNVGAFLYTVDMLRGLALNPSIASKVNTSEPMIDGELYIVNGDISDPQVPHRIFPIMKLLDTDDENGITAFYFYNQWDDESEAYIYVCPYPSAAHQKQIYESPIVPKMINEN